MDPLSDVFRTLRVGSTLYFRANLGTPFGLEVGRLERVTRFHVVVSGQCWVRSASGTAYLLEKGDLALVPHGARHTLSSSKELPVTQLEQALQEANYQGEPDLFYGGPGPGAVLVCGHFQVDDEASHPILEQLPELVHVQACDGFDFSWLDSATRSISHEASARNAGWEVVVDRVSEILLIQVLRAKGHESSPAISAFTDDQLSQALRAVHADPGRDWSLDSLARTAAMSRTSFSIRFRQLMGMTPMAYVTRWRLQRARGSLLVTKDAVARIAEQSGYHSEAAFSRAFQRLYGLPPAAYRRQRAAAA